MILRRMKWNGRGRGARTPDLRFWRPPLYQLSYTPSSPPTALARFCAAPSAWGSFKAAWPALQACFFIFLSGWSNFRKSTLPAGGKPQGPVFTLRFETTESHHRTQKAPPFPAGLFEWIPSKDYSMIEATMPAPTVRPPSRIAKRSFSSIAIGTISSTSTVTLSPGITISVPSGSVTMPVTSVVRK